MPTCPTGKDRYGDKLDAEIALARIQSQASKHRKQRMTRRPQTRAYPCQQCDGWHLTSQEERSNAAKGSNTKEESQADSAR